jgi:hypothetical protein
LIASHQYSPLSSSSTLYIVKEGLADVPPLYFNDFPGVNLISNSLYWCEAINSIGLSRSDHVQLDIFDGNVIGDVVMVVTVLF